RRVRTGRTVRTRAGPATSRADNGAWKSSSSAASVSSARRPRNGRGGFVPGRDALSCSAMRVGINLINFGPGTGPETLARSAELAESLGYHLVMISDHVAITPDVQARYPAPFYDPFTALGWLAGLTRRVELGTTVIIVPYRHPLLTARLSANVDRLSNGRFILGVGV